MPKPPKNSELLIRPSIDKILKKIEKIRIKTSQHEKISGLSANYMTVSQTLASKKVHIVNQGSRTAKN